ncbi:hypothetical protein C8R46DRAFT_1302234 [Mycena filopes]|nr:hypothetical protein C8R46DRAFT_1302234 [Mycena filopes]
MPGVKPSTEGKKTKPNQSKEHVDESLWRASTIDPNRTISATHAVSQYRLTSGVLKLLPFTTSQVTLPYEQRTVTMTLYKEHLAWEKHGGPEAFDAYLNMLEERHRKKDSGKIFQAPEAYRRAGAGLASLSQVAPPPQVGAASHRSLRERFVQQNRLWLWEAANDVLAASANEFGDERLSLAEKQAALAHPFLTGPNAYPPRPAALAPASPSYSRRRTVGFLEIHENMFEGVTTYYWKHGFMVELLSSLIAVIEEHGIEGIGWKSARWEVYHTYTRCIQSLYFSYEDKCWCDDAQDWLSGRMDLRGSRTITTRQDNQSDVGRKYNQMLPFLQLGE